jgi:1-acyl-sn-glycerol-3-phosphate acyltransferase
LAKEERLNLSQFAATLFFILLIVGVAIAVLSAARRTGLSPLQWFLWIVAYLLCKFLWRTQWLNRLTLPAGTGVIIVCNHRSSVDPFFVQTATSRKIHWMVAREYCHLPLLGRFLAACEVIPVGRGGIDTAATKMAIRLAAAGEVVGMLPEGRINMGDEFMMAARPGAALVALKAGVPIVPCYIRGAPYRRTSWSPLLMPARVEVRFGEPIWPDQPTPDNGDENSAVELTRRAIRAIADLAGETDYEPRIAGRNWKPTAAELEEAMAAKDRRDGR